MNHGNLSAEELDCYEKQFHLLIDFFDMNDIAPHKALVLITKTFMLMCKNGKITPKEFSQKLDAFKKTYKKLYEEN